MAVAISAPAINDRTRTQVQAASWTSISAGISLLATVPLVMMLTGPVSNLLFVRGSRHDGDWGYAFMVVFIIVAPATYALFFGTAGELLKTRVTSRVHTTTMRVAAVGMIPYVAMVVASVYWNSGPQESLMIAAGLTIPIAMAATVWASTQNH